jgi:hypothetical protein
MADGHQAPPDPGVPLFLKQYGARRTGTNYLRALIRSNYPADEVVPLMHILGDKHAPPPPFDELWRLAQGEDDPAFSFCLRATRYAAPSNPHPDHPRQREAVRSIAAPLARAFSRGALGFLVSIKDPYAWVVSIARYEGWTSWSSRAMPLGGHLADAVACRCATFNDAYAAWLALARRSGPRCMVVRHEDLLADPAATLCALDARFGLRRAGDALVDLPTEAELAVWDLEPAQTTAVPFDRAYYLEKRYLARLAPPVLDAVTRSIDWELVAPLGYAPAGRG